MGYLPIDLSINDTFMCLSIYLCVSIHDATQSIYLSMYLSINDPPLSIYHHIYLSIYLPYPINPSPLGLQCAHARQRQPSRNLRGRPRQQQLFRPEWSRDAVPTSVDQWRRISIFPRPPLCP